MCPIVPMFMCGLERSNFSFAMCSYVSSRIITSTSLGRCSVLERSILLGLTFHRPSESRVKADWSSSGSLLWQHIRLFLHRPTLHARDHFFFDIAGQLLVPQKVHRVGRPPLGARTQVGGVAKHLRQGHGRSDDLR